MSKWSYLPSLVSLSLGLLQNDDVRAWARRAGQPLEAGFDRASDRVEEAAGSAAGRLLDALNLQRRSSRSERVRSSLAWAGAGAALATGAFVATQLDRSQLLQLLSTAGERVGGVASRSARRVEQLALDEWLELLGRVGLQPKPTWPGMAIRTAGWAGAGTLVGAGTVALIWALHRRRQGKQSDQQASEEATPEPGGDGKAAATEVGGNGQAPATEAGGDGKASATEAGGDGQAPATDGR